MAAKKTKIKKKATRSVNKLKLVEKLSTKLLSLMGSEAKVKVTEDKENEAVVVNVETEGETGLLIGNRGRTLDSIQMIVGMMYRQKTGEWLRILFDVADWREKEKNRLEQLAVQVAERAKSSGEPQPLYNLSPAQRRIVHMVLSTDEQVKTESVGEDKERYLLVSPDK
jgi:spoIIIJ-associated protein